MISPKGYRVSFEYEDLHPTAMKFDKNELLRGLLKQCEDAGVDVRTGTMALKGEDKGTHVKVVLRDIVKKSDYELEAKKLIIAEGVNRKLTSLFGLNKGYQCMGIPLTYEYTLEGTIDIPHNSWIQYYGNVYHPFMEIMVGESTFSDDAPEPEGYPDRGEKGLQLQKLPGSLHALQGKCARHRRQRGPYRGDQPGRHDVRIPRGQCHREGTER